MSGAPGKKEFQPQSILNKGICQLQMGNISKVIDELTRGIKIHKVKGQIRSGADISVQPMIKIKSFLAAIEALFGRRA